MNNKISLSKKIKMAHIITRIITGGAEENTLYTVEGIDKNKYDIDISLFDTYLQYA